MRGPSSTFVPVTDSPVFPALADALRERIAVIADRALYAHDPAGHLEKLRSISESIARLQSELPPSVDPQLTHYLLRCSYDKALAFLDETMQGN